MQDYHFQKILNIKVPILFFASLLSSSWNSAFACSKSYSPSNFKTSGIFAPPLPLPRLGKSKKNMQAILNIQQALFTKLKILKNLKKMKKAFDEKCHT